MRASSVTHVELARMAGSYSGLFRARRSSLQALPSGGGGFSAARGAFDELYDGHWS